jgi:uncharacterized protein
MAETLPTYVLVDGENIDRTVGTIFQGRPRPEQRPRWERVKTFVNDTFGSFTKGLFFLNASREQPVTFLRALDFCGWTAVQLQAPEGVKVVDMGMLKTLNYLVDKPCHIVLLTHDGDFSAHLTTCVRPGRRLGMLAFPEYLSSAYAGIPGVEIFDLEDDVGAFDCVLPRNRPIQLDKFDPRTLLD